MKRLALHSARLYNTVPIARAVFPKLRTMGSERLTRKSFSRHNRAAAHTTAIATTHALQKPKADTIQARSKEVGTKSCPSWRATCNQQLLGKLFSLRVWYLVGWPHPVHAHIQAYKSSRNRTRSFFVFVFQEVGYAGKGVDMGGAGGVSMSKIFSQNL